MDTNDRSVESRAKASWICPVIAWASQIVLGLTLRGVNGLGFFWLFVAVVQLVLILAGAFFGIWVLRYGPEISASSRRGAIAGIILSVGTVLLIGVMFVMNQ